MRGEVPSYGWWHPNVILRILNGKPLRLIGVDYCVLLLMEEFLHQLIFSIKPAVQDFFHQQYYMILIGKTATFVLNHAIPFSKPYSLPATPGHQGLAIHLFVLCIMDCNDGTDRPCKCSCIVLCITDGSMDTLHGTSISHLGKRKIIDSKVPAGTGYVGGHEILWA